MTMPITGLTELFDLDEDDVQRMLRLFAIANSQPNLDIYQRAKSRGTPRLTPNLTLTHFSCSGTPYTRYPLEKSK